MRGLFEHERLKPAMIRTDKGNVNTLSALKKVMNLEITPHNKLTVNFHTLHDQRTHANFYIYISGPKNCKLTNIYIFQDQKLQNNCYSYISGPKTAN